MTGAAHAGIAMLLFTCAVFPSRADAQGIPERNPRKLDVTELASLRSPRAQPRVRFEWDRVGGATEYVLTGKWASSPAWTIHTVEYRVTPRVATDWGAQKIVFDATVPPGNHSWEVVAVFGEVASADFQRPAVKSFQIK